MNLVVVIIAIILYAHAIRYGGSPLVWTSQLIRGHLTADTTHTMNGGDRLDRGINSVTTVHIIFTRIKPV